MRREDWPYQLKCIECGWKRVVPEYDRLAVARRHECTRHKRRLTVVQYAITDFAHPAMKGRT